MAPGCRTEPGCKIVNRQKNDRSVLICDRFLSPTERGGFEPPLTLPPNLISSQAHSTALPPLQVSEVNISSNAAICKLFCAGLPEALIPPELGLWKMPMDSQPQVAPSRGRIR